MGAAGELLFVKAAKFHGQVIVTSGARGEENAPACQRARWLQNDLPAVQIRPETAKS